MSATKLGDITLTKQTGTTLTLATNGKYVNNDVYFDMSVQPGAGVVTIASTDASVSTDSATRNIGGILGTKSSSVPASGNYIKINASGSGSSTITSAGWLNAGSLGTATATNSYYFPVQSASGYIDATNDVTPTASLSGSNVTLSNTNNGIYVTASGGATADNRITVKVSADGYVPVGDFLTKSATSDAQTNAVSYISGVTLTKPTSGTRSFSITVPNGNSTVTFTFNVDSSGNVTIS